MNRRDPKGSPDIRARRELQVSCVSAGSPAEGRVEAIRGQQLLQVIDAFEPRTFTVLQREAGGFVGRVQLLGAPPGRPSRLEIGQQAMDLAEIHSITARIGRSEEHTSELQSLAYLVCRLLLEKKKTKMTICTTLRHW